jgi:hypothetical protein
MGVGLGQGGFRRYIPHRNGKVKRFDFQAERFAALAVLSSKKT